MLNKLVENIDTIYIAYGVTDFRKHIHSLCNEVQSKFKLNPYSKTAFIFCNKRRTSIRILCYDKNGFILAQKTLLNTEKMHFQWPRNGNEMKNITKQQLSWLLSGLTIYPRKYFQDVNISKDDIAI